ncbi:MAG: ubiquinol-cytochrome c reductase cytochrome b subunit [Actinomycetota bacterium]|nr:ubiquinol-cytochrome c reductase cytochrome b subunit [Actinomycetota bacterium]
MKSPFRVASKWFDSRFAASRWVRTALNKIFPDHWSFMLGEIALYSFVVLILTGVYLTFFFDPSLNRVIYDGSYEPLKGVEMSAAYKSTLHITFDVRAGLVMRQMHHWAALVFVAALVVHMCRVFFTGAFRRPRELNWMVGVTLFILAFVNGFAGYSLPDDQLSGTGLRIMYSILMSIPLIGTWLAFLFFGGEFPAESIISRLYGIHILMIPALIGILLVAHLGIMWHQKHTQFKIEGATEDNVVGSPLWPSYAAKSTGLFLMTSAVIAALGGLAQINPIWLYGPFVTDKVSSASQPDWYMGWLEGALRIMPAWETRVAGFEIPNPFYPAILLPGLTFMLLYLWPFLEQRFTKDREPHNLLDRPRDRPMRTALGSAALTFYFLLFLAGGTDVWAVFLQSSVNALVVSFRVAVFIVPIVVGVLTYYLCKELSRSGAGHRKKPAIFDRSPEGGYHARTAPPAPGTEIPELPPEPLPGAEPLVHRMNPPDPGMGAQ